MHEEEKIMVRTVPIDQASDTQDLREWEVGGEGHYIVPAGSRTKIVAIVTASLISEEERYARARLMAAAPDLLKALRGLLVIAGTPITDRQAGVFQDARVAVAKALGQ